MALANVKPEVRGYTTFIPESTHHIEMCIFKME